MDKALVFLLHYFLSKQAQVSDQNDMRRRLCALHPFIQPPKAELAARFRVRKRDMSFGPRTEDGKRTWDTFMTLAATTKKLGISFYEYIRDRITKQKVILPFAELIEKNAKELNLG